MGQVKLMLPNRLGIYLHDTPHRGVFSGERRNVSAGCVRLADAPRLARTLLNGAEPAHAGLAEYRVDLPRPTPVYITYFTLGLEEGRLVRRSDPYGRDPTLLASLSG
jgi:murein L,D-transpeptidase YcbB/YkuD